jgi:hypothetical protein
MMFRYFNLSTTALSIQQALHTQKVVLSDLLARIYKLFHVRAGFLTCLHSMPANRVLSCAPCWAAAACARSRPSSTPASAATWGTGTHFDNAAALHQGDASMKRVIIKERS